MHYAAITCSGKIISKGNSSLAGCTKVCTKSITRHAEMDAIYKVKSTKNLVRSKAVLWSLRWKGDGDGNFVLGNARPCMNCKHVAQKSGIRWVHYSTDDGVIIKEELKNMDCYLTNSTLRTFYDNKKKSSQSPR
jgi:deoxycytidylate deaminase